MSLHKTFGLSENTETKPLAAKAETLVSKIRKVASPFCKLHSPRSCLCSGEDPWAKETLAGTGDSIACS